jgi:hypothetical protein
MAVGWVQSTSNMPKSVLISLATLLIAQVAIRPPYFASAWSFSSSTSDDNTDPNQCGVYLAESSTGHTLGSFVGRGYVRDEIIGNGDSVVHFVDIRHYNPATTTTSNNDNNDDDDEEEDEQVAAAAAATNNARLEKFLATCWSADTTGGNNEGDEVISAVGGPGFCSTGHVGLTNAIVYQPSILLRSDTDLLLSKKYDESTSPGRGAFSTYHNITVLAVDRLVPGMEVFLDFGAEYSQYDNPTIPNMDDYRKMDEGINKMVDFFNKHATRIGEKAAEEVYDFIKKDVLDLVAEQRAPAARALLPETYHGLQEIMDMGGSALHNNPEVVRDVDWLKMNAYCQDNLVVGVSTIEHAGRGAFAARNMKRGEVVAALPLVALHRGKSVLTIPEDKDGGDKEMYQLLYNYMFEHPQSSALFYAAGASTNYINHGGQNANVKMMWSTKEWSHVKDARETSLENLWQLGPVDMIVELVATRPLNKGEEIFLDYGEDWAGAWKDHVANWKKATKNAAFSNSAMTLNEIHHSVSKPPQPFPVLGDKVDARSTKNVELKCHLLFDDEKIERIRNKDGSRTKVYPWIPYAVSGEKRLKSETAIRSNTLAGCDIMDRSGDEQTGFKYVVQPLTEEKGVKILIKNVPHYAIRYVDRPYTNPQHEPSSFRHTIRFPDEIFPTAWRDLSESKGKKDEL